VNIPGLSSGTFGVNKKTTGISTQATKNLTSSSALSSSLFDLGKTRRTNFVAGQFVTQGKGVYNYSRMRSNANPRVYTPPKTLTSTFSSNYANYAKYNVSSGSNSYATGLGLGQVVSQGISLLNQLGVLHGTSSSQATGSQNGYQNGDNKVGNPLQPVNYGTISSEGAVSSISSMESATDSSSLRDAVSSAETQLASMESQTSALESDASVAEQNMETYEKDLSNADKAKTEANSGVTKAKNKVEVKTQVRDSALSDLRNANTAYGEATAALSKAQTSYDAANAALASAKDILAATPQTITDPATGQTIPNPKYAEAQKAVEAKQLEANKAKDALDAAQKEKDKAKASVDSSNKAVKDAEANLEKANKELEDAKTELEQATAKQKTATENYEKAEAVKESAQEAIDKLKAHKQDIEELKSSIDKQKKRLTKLEKKEKQEYAKLDSDISGKISKNKSRESKIDTSDGMNLKEKWLAKKMNKTNVKIDNELKQKSALELNVVLTEMSKKVGTTASDGNVYKTYTHINGTTYYSVNNKLITEEEYKKALEINP
jgi:predicted  nucleic acid-binding Zn-ribbon protein